MTNNIIENGSSFALSINIYGGYDNIVSNNKCSNGNIVVESSSHDNLISNNTTYNTSGAGVVISQGCEDNSVLCNVAHTQSGSAVVSDDGTNTKQYGNVWFRVT